MPSRFIFLLLFCLAAAAAGFGYVNTQPAGGGGGAGAVPAGKPVAVPAGYTAEEFRRGFVAAVGTARAAAGLGGLAADPRLESWLQSNSRVISCQHLEKFAHVEIPGFKSIRLSAAEGGDLRGLSDSLCGMLCAEDAGPDDRMAFLLRPAVGGAAGFEVVVLTGEVLPELTISALNEGTSDTFLNKCPHCHQQVALKYEKSGCGFAVDCPTCRRRCRVIAQDTAGRYHDATTFLLRSRCPELAAGMAPLDVMLTLWRSAVGACRYVEDTRDGAAADLWQTPGQTLRRGAGDCEDSALLLTDWLLTRGISARFVMGTMEGGGHAWCVARVDGTDYLLESTDRHPDMDVLPVVNPRNGYEPTSMMDREALYVRARPGLPFDGDYWSAEKWIRLPRPKPAAARSTAATPAPVRTGKTADAPVAKP